MWMSSPRARIGGTTHGLAVDDGWAVSSGQVIATIENPKLGLQLASLDARIRALDAQWKLAQTELERMRKLRTSGTISQARLDEARTHLVVVTGNRAAVAAERAVPEQQMAEGAVPAPAGGRVPPCRGTASGRLPGPPSATWAAPSCWPTRSSTVRAISMVFGPASSTALTLLVIPAIDIVFRDNGPDLP